jgi:hypothetical protein
MYLSKGDITMIRFTTVQEALNRCTGSKSLILFSEIMSEEFNKPEATVEPLTDADVERLDAQMQEANDTEPIGAPGADTEFARENQRQEEPNWRM